MPTACFLFGRLLCCTLLAFAWSGGAARLVAATSPAAEKRRFDVPADVAEKTLKLFSEQSGRALIVGGQTASNVHTRPVRGHFTAREALDRMLSGTGLVAKEDPENGAFVVHPAPGAADLTDDSPDAKKKTRQS